jgi:NADPH:quinone reductase-like Zn-dependent oxidoreductase
VAKVASWYPGRFRIGAVEVINTGENPEWEKRVKEITKGRGVDHTFETIGSESYRKSLAAAAMGARITTVGFLESNEFTLPIVPMIVRRVIIQGLSVGHRRAFEDMIAAIEVNGLKPVIDRVYDWKDAPAAFDHLERGAFGKIVISVNP